MTVLHFPSLSSHSILRILYCSQGWEFFYLFFVSERLKEGFTCEKERIPQVALS